MRYFMSKLGPVTFQVLNGYMWLVAAVLDSIHLENCVMVFFFLEFSFLSLPESWLL